jgi:hypothetical protein
MSTLISLGVTFDNTGLGALRLFQEIESKVWNKYW